MVYTPNTFTTSTLCFLIQFKVKEQQQRIYFRKFCKEKCWQNIKSKELADKYLQKKNVQNRKTCESFSRVSMMLSINITFCIFLISLDMFPL